MSDSTKILYQIDTAKLGTLALNAWPEGYVLWCGGRIVWQSWPKAAPTPTFEAGKSYRTAGGHLMKVKLVGDHKPQLFGIEQDLLGNRATGSLVTIAYKLDGTTCGTGWEAYQLLPGAIEDEPKAEQPDDTDSVIWRLGIQAQIDSLNEKLADAMDSGKAQAHDFRRKLAELRGRLDFHEHDGLAKRIESLEKVSTLRTDLHIEVTKRLDALERQMPAALGLTTKGDELRPATPVEQAIQALHDRVNQLENYTGLDVRSVQRQAHESEKNAQRKAMLDQLATKPTIKGGWVNVYWNKHRKIAMVGELYDTRKEADESGNQGRIACIQIPDIQEGEGL